MADGIFLGGFAKGVETSRESRRRDRGIDLQERSLEEQTRLAEERLALTRAGQAAAASRADRDFDLRERAFGLQERQVVADEKKARLAEIDSAIDRTIVATKEIIDAYRDGGATQEQIAKAVEPMVRDIATFSAAGGRDPSQYLNSIHALVAAPTQGEDAGPFEGTGMEAQAFNVLTNLGEQIRRGEPLSARQKAAYSLAYSRATEPRITGSPQTGFSIIQPTLDNNLFPTPASIGAPPLTTGEGAPGEDQQEVQVSETETTGTGADSPVTVSPISGPQAASANEAGRTALISQATDAAISVRDAVVDPATGQVDRSLVFSMGTNVPLVGKGLPFTEGRTVRAQMEDALASKLRLETGAQANATEIQNTIDRFMPSNLDSDETIKDKLDRMVSFFTTALSKSDPELFESLMSRSEEQGNIPDPPEGEEGAEFQGFDPASGTAVFLRKDGTRFGVPR